MRKGVSQLGDLKDGQSALGLGRGNIYYVMQTTNANYTQFEADYQGNYGDDSVIVHNTIQSAIDACTTNRNDYVIVMADTADYDVSSAITISKSRIHIIGAGGAVPGGGMATNSVRIHATSTNDCFHITGSNATAVEIAGFFFKCAPEYRAVNLGTVTTWHVNVHDNFVGMATSAGAGPGGIAGTGAANHAVIHDNYINGYSPASTKTANAMIALGANSTRAIVSNNILMAGSGVVYAAGITGGGADTIVRGNILSEGASALGATAGTFTVGIATNFNAFVFDNYFMMATEANAITGGTTSQTRLRNWEGANGNTIIASA
jgi:hypothetical protein